MPQELLGSHGLLEAESSAPVGQDRQQRRERLGKRRRLHQMKRDHELQETGRRKVLRMGEEGGEPGSSGSEEEGGRGAKRDEDGASHAVDIQVMGRPPPPAGVLCVSCLTPPCVPTRT